MDTFRAKVSVYVEKLKQYKQASIIALMLLLAAVPFTVLVIQQQMELRQRASGNVTLTVNRASAKPGERVVVSWNGLGNSSCTNRPDIYAQAQRIEGNPYALLFVLRSNTNASVPTNQLKEINFLSTTNSSIDIGTLTNKTGQFTYTFPAGTTQSSFVLHQLQCGQDAQTNTVIVDNCGAVLKNPLGAGSGPTGFGACGQITPTPILPTPAPARCAPRPDVVRTVTTDNVNKTVTVVARAGTNAGTRTNSLKSITFTSITNADLQVPTTWTLTNPGSAQPKYTFPANTAQVSFVEKRKACGAVTVRYAWEDECGGGYNDFSGAGTQVTATIHGLSCDETPTPSPSPTPIPLAAPRYSGMFACFNGVASRMFTINWNANNNPITAIQISSDSSFPANATYRNTTFVSATAVEGPGAFSGFQAQLGTPYYVRIEKNGVYSPHSQFSLPRCGAFLPSLLKQSIAAISLPKAYAQAPTDTPVPTSPAPTNTPTPMVEQLKLFYVADNTLVETKFLNCTTNIPTTSVIPAGSCEFILATDAKSGEYEFRLIAADRTTVLATSPRFVVGSRTTTSTMDVSLDLALSGITEDPNIIPKDPKKQVLVELFNNENKKVAKSTYETAQLTFNQETGRYAGTITLHSVCDATLPGCTEGLPLPTGDYTVKVTLDGALRKAFPGIQHLITNTSNVLPVIAVIPGDIDANNELNILDYNLLINCFGEKRNSTSCPRTNTIQKRVDITGDDSVDGVDINIFIANMKVRNGD